MTSPPPTTPVEPVIRELCAYLASKSRSGLSPAQFDTGVNVWLAGYVDSLSYVEFLAFIQEQFGVEVSDIDLTGPLISIQALADFICSQSKRG